MIIQLSIGGLTIDLGTIIAFFSGIAVGFLLLLLIYLYALLRGLNKELRLNKVQEEDIDEEEIKWMIDESKKHFKDKELREKEGYGGLLMREIKELTHDVAKKFYPESPYPYLELSIDETLLLIRYVTGRVEQLVDKPILKLFKGMTIRRIVELNNTKTKIEESRLVKVAKKNGLAKVAMSAMKVVQAVNPFQWIKKLTVDKAINFTMVQIGISVITIVGEETYKIYSKKVFNNEPEFETSVDDLYEEIKKDFKGYSQEETNNE